MTTFSIQRRAVDLCVWDVRTQIPQLHQRASRTEGVLVVDETDHLSLVLEPRNEEVEYRITIGDVPLSDLVETAAESRGFALGNRLLWSEQAYFESARGLTQLRIDHQPRDSLSEKWEPLITVEVCVLPSKVGEAQYSLMTDELQRLSRDLLVDLYGKSRRTHDLRLSREGGVIRSHDDELHSIEGVLRRLGPLLHSISLRPASHVVNASVRRQYWGETRLSPSAVLWLARRGESPCHSQRPLSVQMTQKIESFDVPEHRVARAFLAILAERATYCRRVAKDHARAIQAQRRFRDIQTKLGPTLYESEDVPKLRRLANVANRAKQACATAGAISNLSFLRDIAPELVGVHEGAFQRNSEYRLLLQIIRQFLLKNALWYEGDEQTDVAKLTSRLFEQWCYLNVVEGFRSCGLELREWDDVLRENVKSRFILDFDRGLAFDGELADGLRLRFRYEPWILSRESATGAAETLCRGSSGDVAWCPDIVIECLRYDVDDWRPVYAIVMDSKYTRVIRDNHWNNTRKYLQIRSVHTQRQVVRQLWLISPSAQPAIRCEDSAIEFAENGPSCPIDEQVCFQMLVTPGDEEMVNPFRRFATGVMAYLRRHFGRDQVTRGME